MKPFLNLTFCVLMAMQSTTAMAQADSDEPDRQTPLMDTTQTVTLDLPANPMFPQGTVFALVAEGESGNAFIFPTFLPLKVTIYQGEKEITKKNPEEKLGSSINENQAVSVEIQLLDCLHDAMIKKHVEGQATEIGLLDVHRLQQVRMAGGITVSLTAPNRVTGKAVTLGKEPIELLRSFGKSKHSLLFHVTEPEKVKLMTQLSRDDLQVSFNGSYHAKRSKVMVRAHGRVVSEVAAELANSFVGKQGDEQALFVPVSGSVSQNQAIHQFAKSRMELHLEKRAGINCDSKLLEDMLNSAMDQLTVQMNNQQLNRAKTITFVLEGGVHVSIATNQIGEIKEQTMKGLENALRNSSQDSSQGGGSIGIGPFSLGGNYGSSSATDKQSMHKSVEQIGRILSGEINSVAAIDIDQLIQLQNNDHSAIDLGLEEFVNGTAELKFDVSMQSLRDDILQRKITVAPKVNAPKPDIAKYPTGCFICKHNGYPCFVFYRSKGWYFLLDEWGNSMSIKPNKHGKFVGFDGKEAQFRSNGEISWPGNRWLSHKQADTEAFAIYYNRGDRNQRCEIRCHPGGLLLTNEHGARTIAKFDPESRSFVAWGKRGEILPGSPSKIVWEDGGFWQR